MEDINVILNHKVEEHYSYSVNDNLLAPSELTVTITLHEYRKLVSDQATRREAIEKANNERYKAEREVDELKKQIEVLKEKLYTTTIYKSEENNEEGGK